MINIFIIAPGQARAEWKSNEWTYRHAPNYATATPLLRAHPCEYIFIETDKAEDDDDTEFDEWYQALDMDLADLRLCVAQCYRHLTKQKMARFIKKTEKEVAEEIAERERLYGTPAEQEAERREYMNDLLQKCPEAVVRSLLEGLSHVEDFIPAEFLRETDLAYEPLESIFEVTGRVLFYFKDLKQLSDGNWEVDVSHGISMAAKGETFIFKPQETTWQLVQRGLRWIS